MLAIQYCRPRRPKLPPRANRAHLDVCGTSSWLRHSRRWPASKACGRFGVLGCLAETATVHKGGALGEEAEAGFGLGVEGEKV